MGLISFVEKQEEKREIRQYKQKHMESEPRFAGMDVSKIKFQPIDGDVDRMTMYGCYAGDKFTYEGKTYEVEKDDVERIKVTPHIDIKKEFDKKDASELNVFERMRYQQLEEEGRRRIYAQKLIHGDCVDTDIFRLKYYSVTRRIYGIRDEVEQEWQDTGWSIKCTDKKTPMKDVVMPDKMLGEWVCDAVNCFKDARNVASVAHIPKMVIDYGKSYHMFENSGIRELPKQLIPLLLEHDEKAMHCVLYMKAIKDYEKIYCAVMDKLCEKPNETETLGTAEHSTGIKSDTIRIRKNMERDINSVTGELPTFVKFEKLSFMHKFCPTTVLRAQTYDGKWYAINNGLERRCRGNTSNNVLEGMSDSALESFDSFMEKRYSNEHIQNLNTGESAVTPISAEEFADAIKKAYEGTFEIIDKRWEDQLDKLRKECEYATKLADKAQEGLNFMPRDDSDIRAFYDTDKKDIEKKDEIEI